MEKIQELSNLILSNVEKVIVGKKDIIELVIVAMFVEGHVLLEDVPGTGKTMLARSLAITLGSEFKRIQCTPDLMPNDVTGISVYNLQNNQFEFRPGPIFVNILLADEINRATPRTQAALLEAMQEQQVTVDGETRRLPKPFLVLATQNPIEYEGTFPLPEAQLDRFLMKLSVGYPSPIDEKKLLINLRGDHPINYLSATVDGKLLVDIQTEIWDIHVEDSLQEYIINLVNASRIHPDLALGVSPRGSLALIKASQAFAAIKGRNYVLPDDIKYLLPYIFTHRIIVRPEALLRGKTAIMIVSDILKSTKLDLGDLQR